MLGAPGRAAALLARAALPVGLGAVLFLGTLHLQRGLGLGAQQTGLAYLAVALPVVAASPAAARLADRYGRRTVAVAGLLLQPAGLLLLARAPAGASPSTCCPPSCSSAPAPPLAFVPVTAAIMAGAGEASGLVSGASNTAEQLGNAFALAVLATLAATRAAALGDEGLAPAEALTGGLHAAFLLGAVLVAAACLPALRLDRQPPQKRVIASRPRPARRSRRRSRS